MDCGDSAPTPQLSQALRLNLCPVLYLHVPDYVQLVSYERHSHCNVGLACIE